MVQAAIAEKTLPAICQHKSSAVGHWVEFDRDYTDKTLAQKFSRLQPVVWFHFYSKEELRNGEFVAGDEDTDNEDIGFESMDSDSDHGSVDSFPSEILSEDEHIVDDLENEIVQDVLEDLPGLVDEMDGDVDGQQQQPASAKDMYVAVIISITQLCRHPRMDCCAVLCRLEMRLSSRVSGNAVLVKLIHPENLMEEFRDLHSEPNIDINTILLNGKKITLPLGARFLYNND